MASQIGLSRRQFVKDAGGLLIGFSLVDSTVVPRLLATSLSETAPDRFPDRLDHWLRIAKDGSVRVFTDKPEIGMGVQTALAQIVAEELDVAPKDVAFIIGDTAFTANQGGVGGSTTIMLGSKPLRNAAATARFLLLQLASRRLGAPPERLQVRNGIVSVKGDASRNVSYGDLAAGSELNNKLIVSGTGFTLDVQGAGKPKDPASYTVVGQPVPRVDIPPKVLGQFKYVTDVRIGRMLHGRVIRPSGVGANLVSVDEGSVKGIPGFTKTVVKGNFVGVVAESEWAAIQAAEKLKVTWSSPAQAFPEDLYQHMRSATPKATKVTVNRGDAAAALSNAAKKVEASYEWPFQAHATMGPGCALAAVNPDGVVTIWSGSQKPHDVQKGIAELLGVPLEGVRVIWVEDAGSYGRAGYEDTAADAALLSQAVGKPVRVQSTRSDMTGWGPKGPAVVFDLGAGLDAQGGVTAFQFTSRAFSGAETFFRPASACNLLAAQLIGIPNTTGADEFSQWSVQCAAYGFANVNAVAHIVPALYPAASPLRTTHLRDPEGPAVTFAAESFIDEVAAAAGADPVEFRLRYLDDARAKAVLTAAAEKAGWDHRASPKKPAGTAEVVRGRGIALATRNGTYVATVAEVEVNRRSGAIQVKRFVCAHDCGLVVNPDGLRGVISANLIQSLSRTLKEEVTFDRSNVTSVDWITYPVAMSSDVPEKIDIVLLNHPEIAASGAGEPSSRPTAAAIANAVFDATGARVRQAPLTPTRIKAALAEPRPA